MKSFVLLDAVIDNIGRYANFVRCFQQLSKQDQHDLARIMSLKQHSLAGKLFSKLMSDARLEKMMRDMDRDGSPVGFTAFNRFHHGGKVQEQNIQIMENYAATGAKEGRDMTAVNELLVRWYKSRQQSAETV